MDSVDTLNDIFDWARSALNRPGGAATAAELLTAYVAERPKHSFAMFLLGDALRELGRFQEAEETLLRALSCAPASSRASIMARLGMLKNEHGALQEAEHWFRLATSEEAGQRKGWIWIMRGMNLAVMGNFDEAADCHSRAARLEDGDPDEAFLNLGYVRRAQQQYSAAVEAFKSAIEISPDYAEAVAALDGLNDTFDAIERVAGFRESTARNAPDREGTKEGDE